MTDKPLGHINTPDRVKALRGYLGASKTELAEALRLGPNGRQTIRRIEEGQNPTGPMQVALEALRDGWRPRGLRLPIDEGKAS